MIEKMKLHLLSKELLSLAEEVEQQLKDTTESKLLSTSLFRDKLREEIVRADRYHMPFTLCMISPDNYASQKGAQVMSENLINILAKQFESFIRPSDYLGSYNNGQAISLLLPMTSMTGASEVAKRLCSDIEELWEVNHLDTDYSAVLTSDERQFLLGENIKINEEKSSHLTISIGLATYPDNTKEEPMLYQLAEKLLNHAIDNGGNRVEICRQRIANAHLIPSTVETLLSIESLFLSMEIRNNVTQKERETFQILKKRFNTLMSNLDGRIPSRSMLEDHEYKIFEKLVNKWLKQDRRNCEDRRQEIISIDGNKRKTERRRTKKIVA